MCEPKSRTACYIFFFMPQSVLRMKAPILRNSIFPKKKRKGTIRNVEHSSFLESPLYFPPASVAIILLSDGRDQQSLAFSLAEGRVGERLDRLLAVRRGRGTSEFPGLHVWTRDTNIWFLWCLEENFAGKTDLKFGKTAARLRTGWEHSLPMEHSGQDRPRVRTTKVNFEKFGFVSSRRRI